MLVCRRMTTWSSGCSLRVSPGDARALLRVFSSLSCSGVIFPSTRRSNTFKQHLLLSSNRIPISGSHLFPRLKPVEFWKCMSVGPDRGNMAVIDTLHHLHDPDSLSYLSQAEASAIDEELMGSMGFSIDQLMELAGLSVASAIAEVYRVEKYKHILVICGPGNNGGDGLVASRHLFHFGYKPTILYPKRTDKPIYKSLVTQLETLSIPFLDEDQLSSASLKDYNLILDSIFGFSFHGNARPPFDKILQLLRDININTNTQIPIVSVDIPSGWDVELGDKDGLGLKPDMLVSLTAPKLCAKTFRGSHHFLGGRFVPPGIAEKYNLKLPPYPGSSVCVRIGKPPSVDVSALRENYVGAVLLEEHINKDPFKQFQEWFEDAVAAGLTEPNAMTLATATSEGHPSARVVLLKGYDHRGFVWYTNYGSRKASELLSNPWASLVFFWDKLHRQIRVEGKVEKVSDEESDEYFHSRPRGSQIGAIVSRQSEVLPGRQTLDDQYKSICEKYADGSYIPRPNFWGGFRLLPVSIEFWQGRESRLHDRLVFTREGVDDDQWRMQRLSP
ncbi:hypothetical protein KP509_17G051300 [Ceratopteris richardii]|uniref:NAD(P)H-hydrate epimerase n=2 Tax=Ceratopteris richardii TaxID=49495 RepID=A0A8T2SZD8_CERRI|nr:hypothetical protein KP509_17G051300 [Ceratopteris richardii]